MGKFKETMCKYCFHPIKCGILGFIIFLLVIVVTKLLGTVFNNTVKFTIDFDDLILSFVGFVMFFMTKILNTYNEQFRERI
jgi:hypothetical protein